MAPRAFLLILFPLLLSGCAAPPRPLDQTNAVLQPQTTPPDQKILIKTEPLKDQYWTSAMSTGEYLKNFYDNDEISALFVVFKQERKLDVYVKDVTTDKDPKTPFDERESFDLPVVSGHLGPKRAAEDLQTPEGLYTTKPSDQMYDADHYALLLDYPNASDKILTGDPEYPGGAIHIAPGTSSNGSVTLFTRDMDLLADIAWHAKFTQKKIPVYIFPFKMTAENMAKYCAEYPQYKTFWTNLKTSYDRFESTHRPLDYTINANGDYILK